MICHQFAEGLGVLFRNFLQCVQPADRHVTRVDYVPSTILTNLCSWILFPLNTYDWNCFLSVVMQSVPTYSQMHTSFIKDKLNTSLLCEMQKQARSHKTIYDSHSSVSNLSILKHSIISMMNTFSENSLFS